jgi:hypothetical protein
VRKSEELDEASVFILFPVQVAHPTTIHITNKPRVVDSIAMQ